LAAATAKGPIEPTRRCHAQIGAFMTQTVSPHPGRPSRVHDAPLSARPDREPAGLAALVAYRCQGMTLDHLYHLCGNSRMANPPKDAMGRSWILAPYYSTLYSSYLALNDFKASVLHHVEMLAEPPNVTRTGGGPAWARISSVINAIWKTMLTFLDRFDLRSPK
jgi:hypothetical protein